MTIDSKMCTKCLVTKPITDFSTRGQRNGEPLPQSRCKSCQADAARDWYRRNSERANTNRRRLALRESFGITPEDYEAMLAEQGGVCAICQRPERAKRDGKPMRLSVDHCHTTGHVRGLLCHACNRGIGLCGEDLDWLGKAIRYLEEHATKPH